MPSTITAIGAAYEEPVNLTPFEKEILRSMILREINKRKRNPSKDHVEDIINKMFSQQLGDIVNKLS